MLHSDLVLGPVDEAAVFTQATYMRYVAADWVLHMPACRGTYPSWRTQLQFPDLILMHRFRVQGPIRPSPVQAKVPMAKKPRKARFVQEMERDEILIPNDDVTVETKPSERRDFTKMVAASDIDPDAKLRPYVCGLRDQLSD